MQSSPISAEQQLHIRAKAARMELICLLSLDVLCMEAAPPGRSCVVSEKPGSFLTLLGVNFLPMNPNKQKNFTLAGLCPGTQGSSGSQI